MYIYIVELQYTFIFIDILQKKIQRSHALNLIANDDEEICHPQQKLGLDWAN